MITIILSIVQADGKSFDKKLNGFLVVQISDHLYKQILITF